MQQKSEFFLAKIPPPICAENQRVTYLLVEKDSLFLEKCVKKLEKKDNN